MARVTRTHDVGTNPLQTGRSLATASSRPLALRDHPLSFLNTGEKIFPCSPYCQTPSQSRKVCPAHFLSRDSVGGNVLLSQRKCPSSLRPPQPHMPAGAPLPTGSGGRTAAGRFLELVPLASLLPDRDSGAAAPAWNSPIREEKSLPDCGNPNLPQRWMGDGDQVPLL